MLGTSIHSLICASLIRNSKFSTKLTVQAVGEKKVIVLHTVPLLGRGQLNFFSMICRKKEIVSTICKPVQFQAIVKPETTGRYIYPSQNSKLYVRVILKRDMYLITHGERML